MARALVMLGANAGDNDFFCARRRVWRIRGGA